MIPRLDKFKNIHPLQDEKTIQGCLELIYNLENILNDITGMDSTTLQPSAGSQGEFAGILVMSKSLSVALKSARIASPGFP